MMRALLSLPLALALAASTRDMLRLVWDVILNDGEGTEIDFNSFDREAFERSLAEHTKVVLKF